MRHVADQTMLALAVLGALTLWTVAVPCDDTTTARAPDASCPPNTQGALGLSGFIESSTIQSCTRFDKQELDCGDGNATVIVLGIIPGQQAPVLNLNVITHHETDFEDGAQCSANVDGKCVTIEPIQLTVTASNSVVMWSLQDTNIESYYAYTHAFSGATSQQTEKQDKLDDDCDIYDRSKSEIAKQSNDNFFSQTCLPLKNQVQQQGNRDDWMGLLLYPNAVNCFRQIEESQVQKDARRFDIPEYCTVPYPKTQLDTDGRNDRLGLDPATGLKRGTIQSGFGAYRFPSFTEVCGADVREDLSAGNDAARSVCFPECGSGDRSAGDQERFDYRWQFYDADTDRLTCARRCIKKYSQIKDNHACRVWAGNYATQMPMLGSELRAPKSTVVPDDVDEGLRDYFEKDESGDNVQSRNQAIQANLLSEEGVFNYASYLWHKRPICPGCPGPYGPWPYYLYPRKPNTRKGKYENNAPPDNGQPWYPHHTQCYQDDDDCCDAKLFQDVGSKKNVIPVAECTYAKTASSVCPLRRGVLDFSGKADNDNSVVFNKESFENIKLNEDELLPPYVNADEFKVLNEGWYTVGRTQCLLFYTADECDVLTSALSWYDSEEVVETATDNAFLPSLISGGKTIRTVVALISSFFSSGLNPHTYYLTTASAMGFMYPKCKAYSIREQPALYVDVEANIKFTARRNEPESTLRVGNMGLVARDASGASTAAQSPIDGQQSASPSASLDNRSMYMRILNLDSTAQAIGRNLAGVVTVCNATNHLIFEADDADISTNPWDDVPKKTHGIYTTLPGALFEGNKAYGAKNRHPNKCANVENPDDCNTNSWWYMDKREHYGNGCGQLGIDEAYFASTYNQQRTCSAPLQNCIPGLNPAFAAEQIFGFEDRVSDRIEGTNQERNVRDSINVQTPCQMSSHLLDIEGLTEQEAIASRLNPANNRINPLPPNWVELEGGPDSTSSGYSNPKYALHGTNLLYYGTFNRAAGTNYIRVEVVIAGNVVSATETISTGRFERGTIDPEDPTNPSCGLVIDGTGGYSVIVRNTGSQPSAYRIKGSCNQPDLLVRTVNVATLRADETRRVTVGVDNVQTDESLLTPGGPIVPRCTLTLVHPTYDVTFDTLQSNCSVVSQTSDVPYVPNPFVGCTTWDDPACSQDIRNDVLQTSSATPAAWIACVVVEVLLVLSITLFLLCNQFYVTSVAEEGRLTLRMAQMGSAGVKSDLLAKQQVQKQQQSAVVGAM